MPTPESANAAAYGSSGGYPANPGGPGQIGFGVIFFVTLVTLYNMPQYTCVLVAIETIQEVRTKLQNFLLVHVHVYVVLSDLAHPGMALTSKEYVYCIKGASANSFLLLQYSFRSYKTRSFLFSKTQVNHT